MIRWAAVWPASQLSVRQEIQIRSDLTGSAARVNPDKGDPDGDIGDSGESVAIRYNNQNTVA